MLWFSRLIGFAALVSTVSCQDEPDSKSIADLQTGFTFGSFTNDNGITYNIAIPSDAITAGNFDVVFQTIVPIGVGWSGFAWGGSMTYNPLTIVWLNGQDMVVSSREAYGYYVPPVYENATYTILQGGTHVNSTHYQVTVKCTGCTYWGDTDFGYTALDPTQSVAFAFAFSMTPPENPTDGASSFSIHDQVGHWIHDLTQGSNPSFASIVTKNS
ncbi:CBD9-like protein [Pleurostoma richardsiae]|uniref:CBD9-like protein n=1 Tax=Pleurostoma richardsiae TaxID=41990 RepID=A0AA38VN16_9PEZI|nr:CBD9-like protein [Pleurostoma richardsiae]